MAFWWLSRWAKRQPSGCFLYRQSLHPGIWLTHHQASQGPEAPHWAAVGLATVQLVNLWHGLPSHLIPPYHGSKSQWSTPPLGVLPHWAHI